MLINKMARIQSIVVQQLRPQFYKASYFEFSNKSIVLAPDSLLAKFKQIKHKLKADIVPDFSDGDSVVDNP